MYLLMKKVNRKILPEAAAGRAPDLWSGAMSPYYTAFGRLSACLGRALPGQRPFRPQTPYNMRHGLLTPKGVKRPPLNTLALYCFNTVT